MFCPRCHREYDDAHRFCPYDGEPLTTTRQVELVRSKPTRLSGVVLGDRYEVRGFIGKGAMARVYLAEDLETKEAVAVKVLDVTSARGSHARDRFLREARAAARIGHPNIIHVLDSGVRSDGAPYLVMEFLFGESLGELVRREGPQKPDIALPVLGQAASALAAAHRAGIVHRDVKPDNIFLVGEPGDPYAVKVLDFGLAKLTEQSGFTAAGVAVGTIEYMAPEQVVTDTIDARTDVYGLGVVMYRVFTGRLPFHSSDDADLLAHQLLTSPAPPRTHVPDLDPAIEAVILMALHKRPENRYASMDELLADLERLMGRRTGALSAGPPTHTPDIYEPKGPFAKNATEFFYKKLGLEPPRPRR